MAETQLLTGLGRYTHDYLRIPLQSVCPGRYLCAQERLSLTSSHPEYVAGTSIDEHRDDLVHAVASRPYIPLTEKHFTEHLHEAIDHLRLSSHAPLLRSASSMK